MAGIISRLTNTGNLLLNGTFNEVSSNVVTSGLIAYLDASNTASYPGTGTAITDLSNSSAHGTINGTISFVSAGSASYFNFATASDTNYISSTVSQTYLDFTIVLYPDFTLSNPNSITGLIATSAPATSSDDSLRLTLGTPWNVTARNPGDLNDWAYPTSTTYYVNGAASNSLVSGWNIFGGYRTNQTSFNAGNSFPYFLGTSGYPGRGFQGRIAAVLLYNRQLTANEQLQNYNALAERFNLPIKPYTAPTSVSVTPTTMYASEFDEVTKPTPSNVAKRELSTGVIQIQGEFDEVTWNPPIVTDGLVLNLDAANPYSYNGGTTWTDLSSYGNNGTLFNSPTYSSAGGGSLTFNGTSSFVSVPNSASLNPGSNGWTVSIWFNATSAALAGVYGGPILYNKEVLYEGAVGTSVVQIAWQPSWAWYGTTPTLTAGVWYHTVHTYDGANQRIYLNGVQTWSQAMTGVIGTNTYDLGIGCRGLSGGSGAGASSFFAGSVSTFSMYNRALSATEIQQNFNAQRTRFGI